MARRSGLNIWILLPSLMVALFWLSPVMAGSCGDTEKRTETGSELINNTRSYADAKQAAIRSAVISAIQAVNPTGFTSLLAGRYSSKSDASGSSENIEINRKDYQRIRGLTKSINVLKEDPKPLGEMILLNLEVEIEVCLNDKSSQEKVISLDGIYWLDGSPSNTVRQDFIANFPGDKKIVLSADKTDTAYSDVSLTGKVTLIDSFMLVKSKGGGFSLFGSKKDKGKRVKSGYRLSENEEAFLEVAVKVTLNARVLATHKVMEYKGTAVKQIPFEFDNPNWNKNRHAIAQRNVRIAFLMASRDLIKDMKKL